VIGFRSLCFGFSIYVFIRLSFLPSIVEMCRRGSICCFITRRFDLTKLQLRAVRRRTLAASHWGTRRFRACSCAGPRPPFFAMSEQLRPAIWAFPAFTPYAILPLSTAAKRAERRRQGDIELGKSRATSSSNKPNVTGAKACAARAGAPIKPVRSRKRVARI
jgi:hypothetical protein